MLFLSQGIRRLNGRGRNYNREFSLIGMATPVTPVAWRRRLPVPWTARRHAADSLGFEAIPIWILIRSCGLKIGSSMKSMLIIDSSEVISRLFAEIFEGRGWKVAICGDQGSALARLAGHDRYDAVLVGSHVSGTSGARMVRFIRSLEHRRTAAVVMVTSTDDGQEDGISAGADEVLKKPVNPNALIWAVDKHVR